MPLGSYSKYKHFILLFSLPKITNNHLKFARMHPKISLAFAKNEPNKAIRGSSSYAHTNVVEDNG